MIQLPPDFKEFLKLLNEHQVEYLLVGGHAVGFHGYPRPTGDLDIWIAVNLENAQRMVNVLQAFGFALPQLSPELFLDTKNMVRMGVPPVRIEILTEISGVVFEHCYARRITATVEDIAVNFINEDDLKINKKASGRNKDLNDLENLS
jgi:hypothetical protein